MAPTVPREEIWRDLNYLLSWNESGIMVLGLQMGHDESIRLTNEGACEDQICESFGHIYSLIDELQLINHTRLFFKNS